MKSNHQIFGERKSFNLSRKQPSSEMKDCNLKLNSMIKENSITDNKAVKKKRASIADNEISQANNILK